MIIILSCHLYIVLSCYKILLISTVHYKLLSWLFILRCYYSSLTNLVEYVDYLQFIYLQYIVVLYFLQLFKKFLHKSCQYLIFLGWILKVGTFCLFVDFFVPPRFVTLWWRFVHSSRPAPSQPADLQLPPTHPGPDPRRAVVCRRVWLVSQVTGWSLVRQTDTSISQRPVSQPLHCAVPPGWRLGGCCGRVWENRDTPMDFEKI